MAFDAEISVLYFSINKYKIHYLQLYHLNVSFTDRVKHYIYDIKFNELDEINHRRRFSIQ